ncbi:hypothetical protein GCM10020227_04900 [Streptomyces flavovirens]
MRVAPVRAPAVPVRGPAGEEAGAGVVVAVVREEAAGRVLVRL